MSFRFDYAKTMMMKLFLSKPDRKGGSEVICDFKQALEIIKNVDMITMGAPKIIYLVGWQYNGHDDKYPAFFSVNEKLKAPEDKSALESMLNLINEAKRYNTTVSVHINLTDAYENSPLFNEYKDKNALIRTRFGRPAKIESYNGLPCYKVSYKEEWESGLFEKRLEKLLSLIPLEDIGTVHVDNFKCYANRKPKVSIDEMQEYRIKMTDRFAEKGIDVTSESTYREGKLTSIAYGKFERRRLPTKYPIAMLNRIPAVWWTDKLKEEEIMRYFPYTYGGGLLAKKSCAAVLYGNIHGEDIWMKSTDINEWFDEFAYQFAMINVPFFYLNTKIRSGYRKNQKNYIVEYTDGTISDGKMHEIRNGGKILKNNSFMCLPLFWQDNAYIAYTKEKGEHTFYVEGRTAQIFRIRKGGAELIEKADIFNEKVKITTEANTLYFIVT